MVKRVLKYATGADVPKNAVYLNTVTQTKIESYIDRNTGHRKAWTDCFLVWHYYEVEVGE